MNLARSESQDTLSTLISTSQANASDLVSVFTATSDETLLPLDKLIFGKSISGYTSLYELPIVSNFLSPGISLFKSFESFELNEAPILTIQTSVLSIFKKNSPLSQITTADKSIFCKVYFKILNNNLTCHILQFQTLPYTLILYNNGIKSCIDLLYKNTKLRISGTSSSTFGNSLISIKPLTSNSPSLIDDLQIKHSENPKNFKILQNGELFDSLIKQNKKKITELLNKERFLCGNVPLAWCIDNEGGGKVSASIKMFAVPSNSPDLDDDSMVLCCILLVLREQEIRKMRGKNQASYINQRELR
ncbi:hypothetical protein HYPBUDRAFT_5972 [Hyphopichia burtonii NRRL Y-1933]|uniref:Uncharacterized protein n=1 Tax=Hyphopichia burtonii NRRL Y-1933 TaxID=984485 RepID=A0A1E4RLW1_9ASCO|nr:hypothetical protein HYPBUDRAFT_5972 [Hyphopichia burtonii NRRL Y-1933]ODV68171.1 hypothetical protein HYPBUDRAFT_5972 [Hyphopichia burtonii NRRL Y-1933]